jgi:class 3 adenylate cyclase
VSLSHDDLTQFVESPALVPLGHRKRLLRAIFGLTAAERSATPSVSTGATLQDAAERRQLTVMFCDLVGSTPLSTRFDPGDLREIVGTYHRCVTDTVGRFGGFVAKYMGDGVLIYFGYPEAHEDDAERAVRAGLAVIDQLPWQFLTQTQGRRAALGQHLRRCAPRAMVWNASSSLAPG